MAAFTVNCQCQSPHVSPLDESSSLSSPPGDMPLVNVIRLLCSPHIHLSLSSMRSSPPGTERQWTAYLNHWVRQAARTDALARVRVWPAWKCVHALLFAHIQAHQPPLLPVTRRYALTCLEMRPCPSFRSNPGTPTPSSPCHTQVRVDLPGNASMPFFSLTSRHTNPLFSLSHAGTL